MELKNYIKDLLLQTDGLVIPGLGGFVSEYEPASFDVVENKFLPPTKKLFFKPEYAFSDPVLEEYIKKKENITIEEAKEKIEDLVTQVKNDFKKGGFFVISGVGTISQSAKGEIQFKQDRNFNLLTDSFGLKSIKTKPLSEKKKPLDQNIQRTPRKSFKKPLLISASIIIISLLAFFAWTITEGFTEFSFLSSLFRTNNTNTEQKDITTKSVEYLDSIARADSLKASINKTIDVTTVKKEALFYTEQTNLPEESKPSYSKFYIIAGSFQTIKNAEKFSAELSKKGFETEIIESDKTHFRISIASYTSEGEALKELYNFRANPKIKQAWILKTN